MSSPTRSTPTNNEVPPALYPDNPVMNLQPSDSVATRRIELKRKNGMWTVNGHTWDDVVASNFTLVGASAQGQRRDLEFVNGSGGWQHPLHIHLVDFKILDRNGKPPFAYEKGPKDVAYLGENETVRVIMRFDGCGKYMIHCHNLVHEDHDMMSQYEVVDDTPGDDPLGWRGKNGIGEPDDPL